MVDFNIFNPAAKPFRHSMRAITAISIFIICVQPCMAQYFIHGTVTGEGNRPLPGVTVKAVNADISAITDSTGNYGFEFDRPATTLHFTHSGYESLQLEITEPTVKNVRLQVSTNYLSQVTLYAFEGVNTRKTLPAAVTLINAGDIEKAGNYSFVQAVNNVPGVKMDERSPGSYRVSIRGNLLRSTFGVRNVKVYWNGIPFTDANGNTYLNELAVSNIGKIEIIRGPSGSMYGAGTGGVILLGSNFPTNRGQSLRFFAEGGSYGMFTAGGSWNNTSETGSSVLSFTHLQSDGYRRHSNLRRDVANFSGRYSLNASHTIQANIFYSDLFYETPGGLTFEEMKRDARQARPAAGIFKSAETQQAALYLKTIYAGLGSEYKINEHFSQTSSLYVSNTVFRNPTIRNYERKTEQGLGLRYVLKYRQKGLSATFGGEYQYGFTNTSTFGNKGGIIDSLQYHDEISARQVTVFLQGNLDLPYSVILLAGTSFNSFHYGFTRLSEFPSLQEHSSFTPQVVPRVSLLKKIGTHSSVFVTVSKGYSPPSIDEVHASDGKFNRSLEAERGVNYEGGLKSDILPGKLFLEASVYLFRLSHTIVSRRDASGGDYYVNVGNTKQVGVELALQYQGVVRQSGFLRQYGVWTNFTNIQARFIHYRQGTIGFDGNRLTGTPPQVLSAGVDLKTGLGIAANLSYSYTSSIPLNDANGFYARSYQLLSARFVYACTLHGSVPISFFIRYKKSLDNPYSLGNDLNASGNRFYNPAAVQEFSGGIQVDFTLKRN